MISNAHHWRKWIPGSPDIIVQNMPGGRDGPAPGGRGEDEEDLGEVTAEIDPPEAE